MHEAWTAKLPVAGRRTNSSGFSPRPDISDNPIRQTVEACQASLHLPATSADTDSSARRLGPGDPQAWVNSALFHNFIPPPNMMLLLPKLMSSLQQHQHQQEQEQQEVESSCGRQAAPYCEEIVGRQLVMQYYSMLGAAEVGHQFTQSLGLGTAGKTTKDAPK